MAAFRGWRLTRTGILFVVGILVLGGLVTGGIFLVKNHGEAVRRDQAVKIAEQNLKTQSNNSAQPTNGSNAGDSNSTDASKNTTGTPGAAGTAGTPGADANNGAAPTTATTNSSELPVTGINDLQLIEQAAIMAVVALSVAYYVASRRAASNL